MELMKPKKQSVWGWPAAINFLLGGAGAGLYLMLSAQTLLQPGSLDGYPPGAAGLLPSILVCMGFLALTHEAGRPLRGLYLLSNLRNSWISIELLAGGLFASAALIDRFFPLPALRMLALLSALAFITSQGFVIYRARAVYAWNTPLIPLLFLTSALAMGGGLLLLLGSVGEILLEESILMVVLIVLIADTTAWTLYVRSSRDTTLKNTEGFLRRPLCSLLVVGLGHALPLSMLVVIMITGGHGSNPVIFALTGLSVLAGGVSQKGGIIFGAGFLREVVMGSARNEAQPRETGTGRRISRRSSAQLRQGL